MRHRKSGRKLGMDSSARKAMYRNMVTSLVVHGQIRTTEARAKELRRYAERVISMGKRAPSASDLGELSGAALQQAEARRVAAIRRVRRWVHDDEGVERVFGEYAERFRTRPGGYTRIVKAARRPGDGAPMAWIELVEALQASETAGAEAPAPSAAEEAESAAAEEAAAAPEDAVEVTDEGATAEESAEE